MTRTDVLVLEMLIVCNATAAVEAKTIKELLDIEDYAGIFSYSTLYRCLKNLTFVGLIGNGPKDHKAETYFIKEKGKSYYESLVSN